ncbi:MAG: T9SS type A sorting domain-containing protein [Bacteroidia bacterium]
MRKFLFTLCIAFTQLATAQIIPTTLTTNWKKAGHEAPYAKKVLKLNISAYGGNNTGTVDNTAALTSAIAALGAHAGVINFSSGDYLFSSSINLPDSVVLRGVGAGATTLTFNFNGNSGNCINMNGGVSGSYVSVVNGYTKNSKSIKLNSVSGFAVGNMIEIRELNGSWNTNPATWAEYAVGQILKIDSIKGLRLYFHEKLRISYDSTLSVQVAKLNMRKACGVECLKMRRIDGTAPSINYGVSMSRALNCWVKGVELETMICAHIAISTSAHCEVTGCYLHEAYAYDGTSTHGYGIMLESHPTENKIENNIIRHLRHAVSVKQGANGNVIAYNYTLEPTRSEFPSDAGADLNLHGHYAFANLFEGNIVQNIQVDQTWGPSGPWNTFFRNRADGYGFIITSGSVATNDQNIVGNDITSTAFLKGNYSLTGTNHFQYGNRVQGNITPAGTTNLTTTSYYLTVSPTWWTSTTAWPTVGLPYSLTTATNPARDRWLAGSGLTVCSTTVTKEMDDDSSTSLTIFETGSIELVPNPSSGVFHLFTVDESSSINIKVYNIVGTLVMQKEITDGVIDLSAQPSGIYMVQIQTGETTLCKKILIENPLHK